MAKHNAPPWLKAKSPPARTHAAVAWYTEDEWAGVKAAATDPDGFEPSFKQWAQAAEEALRKFRTVGVVATKVAVRRDELLAWCAEHQKVNDAASRAQFVAELGGKRPAAGA